LSANLTAEELNYGIFSLVQAGRQLSLI
jgi:hypothetical protein